MLEGQQYGCLIGVGNEWRGDDSVGCQFVKEAVRRSIWQGPWKILSGEIGGLVETITERPSLLLVDAYAISEEFYRKFQERSYKSFSIINASEYLIYGQWQKVGLLKKIDRDVSSHGLGVFEALSLAESLGIYTGNVHILGIPGYSFEPGRELSQISAYCMEGALEWFQSQSSMSLFHLGEGSNNL